MQFERRVIQQNGTLYISIPKDLAKSLTWEKESTLFLEEIKHDYKKGIFIVDERHEDD